MIKRFLSLQCLLCRCESDNSSLCTVCVAALPSLGEVCRVCALPVPDGAGSVCGRCLRKTRPVTRTVAAWAYREPVSGLIARFKFHADLAAGLALTQTLIAKVEQAYRDDEMPQVLLPVTLSTQRLRQRGFNQAQEIARELGRSFALALIDDAVLRRDSPDQIGLRALARRRNVRGVFSINDNARSRLPAHIAIVDDVVTTGATVLELTRVLQKNGAQRVDVWCLARTPRA